MRIGIFVVEAGRSAGGPETYEIHMLRALANLDRTNEYFIYCTHQGAIDAIGVRQDNFTYRLLRPTSRWLSIPVSLPVQLVRDGVRFFHATMVPPPWSPKDYCMSVLCFSNWSHPEFYPKHVLRRLNYLLEIGIREARYLLCNSANLRDDIQRAFHIAPERLSVTHLGVGPEFSPMPGEEARALLRERHGIDYPYVLFVGKHQERKNVFRVIEAYARYRGETGTESKLLLVGRAPSTEDAIHAKIIEQGVLGHVERIRYIPYEGLRPLYAAADMFLFPSLWEGFGLPVIESMSCATPVVTSNVTSLPEIAGDAAVVIDPESTEQLIEGMVRIHDDAGFREALVARGRERAARFTWDACARATMETYERMAAA